MMRRRANKMRYHRRSGITLIETVLSLLILAGAFASGLTAIGSARASQVAAAERRFALSLAEDMMDEVLAEPNYKEGNTYGLEAGERASDRQAFDDMDDYDDWSSTPPVDYYDVDIPGGDGYSRRVQILYVNPDNPTQYVSTDMGLAVIIVRVRFNTKIVAEIRAYRSDVWRSPLEAD